MVQKGYRMFGFSMALPDCALRATFLEGVRSCFKVLDYASEYGGILAHPECRPMAFRRRKVAHN